MKRCRSDQTPTKNLRNRVWRGHAPKSLKFVGYAPQSLVENPNIWGGGKAKKGISGCSSPPYGISDEGMFCVCSKLLSGQK